ncbi:MAG: hypothetical protein K9G67_10405 [Bacteroidales bacterium]|nr:hypothetical protein [Bacteroidales bacterium]MCF8349875.1 hypothetical protein [Bacteroidales bacterium]MCF8376756.1 hypothetical protein [Bacteroidales bacterium]
MRKFFGTTIFLGGLVYAVWYLFGGGIDFYPRLDRLQEGPAMEFLNLSVNLAVIFASLVFGLKWALGYSFGRK